MGWLVERDDSSFFSGVCMTIDKRYDIMDRKTIKIKYFLEVSGWIDVLEYTIHNEEDLEKIPEFEKEAEKKEQEMKDQITKLKNMEKKLRSMGYKPVEDYGD